MARHELISGEHFDHKLAAIFDSEPAATSWLETLSNDTSLQRSQLMVIQSGDRHPGWELEPEDRGIWKTLLRSHLWLAVAGAVLGGALCVVLMVLGVGFVSANGLTALMVFVGFGAVFGLLAGGLVTLRPDHSPYLVKAQSALRRGKIVLAVHARTHEQLEEAQRVLKGANVEVVSTF